MSLAAAGGRVVAAAERLGVSRYVLYRLMKQHGVSADGRIEGR